MKRLLMCAVASLCLAVSAPMAIADQPKQGGAAVITFNNDLTTLDPQVGYDWQNWSVIKSIFDGLMDYKPGTTELEPDLAKEYTISDDGLTYRFLLRPEAKFHDGTPITAADVAFSFTTLKKDGHPIILSDRPTGTASAAPRHLTSLASQSSGAAAKDSPR